jgi:hypothetical protein
VEKPSTLRHSFEPATLAKETRIQIATAVLTILKAYWADQPVTVEGGSDFHEWTALVREPILWLQLLGLTVEAGIGDVTDPAMALGGDSTQDDPTAVGHAQLLEGLKQMGGLNKTFQASDVYKWFGQPDPQTQPARDMIREGLDNILSGKSVNPVSIGRVLAYRKDRFAGGLRLVRFGDSKLGAHWKVSS